MSIAVSALDSADLQSYTGLVASIQSRMDRTDIAADIPSFIYLAEREMDRLVHSPFRETSAAIALDGASVALPDDFKEMRLLSIPGAALRQVGLSELRDYLLHTGTPQGYAVVGETLVIGPVPASSYAATIVYERKIPALSEDVPSNWLLDRHADAYFYGALVQGFAHVADETRAAAYRAMFLGVIQQINEEGIHFRHSGGPLRPRAVVAE